MRRVVPAVVLVLAVGAIWFVVRPGGPEQDTLVPDRPVAVGVPGPTRAPAAAASLPPLPGLPYAAPRAVSAALDGCVQQGTFYEVRWHVDFAGGQSWATAGTVVGGTASYTDVVDVRFFAIDGAVVSRIGDGRREKVDLPVEQRRRYELSEVCP